MPGNLLSADTQFPSFGAEESEDQKFQKITSYLFLLLEQLRYTLSNLGQENFNETELDAIGEILTRPVKIRVENAEGNIAELRITADGLVSSVSNAQEEISTLTQTADRLTAEFGADGRVTRIEANINGLKVATQDGVSGLAGNALYFYDPESPDYARYLAGLIRMDQEGEGSQEESKYRMIIATHPGYLSREYSLKLRSSGDASFESGRNIFITSGVETLSANGNPLGGVTVSGGGVLHTRNGGRNGGDLTLQPPSGQHVSISDGAGGWYTFTGTGITHNGQQIGGE